MPGIAGSRQRLELVRKDPPCEPSERARLCWHLNLGLLAFGTGSQDISVVLSQAEDQASGEQTLGAMESRKREDVGLHPVKSSVLGVAPGTLPITASVNLRPVLTRKDREP